MTLKELNFHIGCLEELEAKVSRDLCDSGTGCCKTHRAAVAALPTVNLCLELLRAHRTSPQKDHMTHE